MASTYLQLVNKVLRRLNETEISSSDFSSVIGIHAYAKDAVNSALAEINSTHFEWPFNSATYTETLVAGQSEYDFTPTDIKTVDWDSFQIQKSDALGSPNRTLRPIDKDHWYEYQRDVDNTNTDGSDVPTHVFRTYNNGFGVTPVPNAAYTVKFRYFKNFTPLSAHGDETTVPPMFDNVVVNGALKYMYVFLDNPQQASLTDETLFKPTLRAMRSILINDDLYMRDTRVNF